MARIILHIGTHKTGTTSLQRSLFEQRDKLKECGISYDPRPGVLASLKSYAHHGLAHRLARFDSEDQQILAQYRLRLEQALANGQNVIISAEPFYRNVAADHSGGHDAARICFMDRVADYFSGMPVEVSVCFRRPDRMAESMFKEQVARTDNELHFLPWLEAYAPRFDYAARVAEFEERFGPSKVWCFEDAVAKGLMPTFLKLHGLHVSGFTNAKADRRSVSARAALWLLSAKREAKRMRVSERRIRWYYAASDHCHSKLAHCRGETFWPDAETRDNFLHAALADFRYADFWSPPGGTAQLVHWAEQDQSVVESHFENWAQRSSVLLEMRKAAKLAPYDADDAIPHALKWKFLPKRIWARFVGSKSNWRK